VPSRREIRQMFMMEAGFIGLIGGVVGFTAGLAAGPWLESSHSNLHEISELPVHGHFFVVTLPLALERFYSPRSSASSRDCSRRNARANSIRWKLCDMSEGR